MFNFQWFQKNQKILLWLLNTPVISTWFRWILKINGNRSSIGKNKIIRVLPNSVTWKTGKKYQTEFRTHDKFAKRIKYAFYPIWYLAHIWDTLFANSYQPNWNLGFDTLTVYPDAGSGATTVDGVVQRGGVNETFATIRAGAGNYVSATDTSQGIYIDCSTTSGQAVNLNRMILTFNTSALTASATVSTAIFSYVGYSKGNTQGLSASDAAIGLVGSTPASNNALVNGDYGQLGTTRYATDLAYASFNVDGTTYNDQTMNATGVAAVSPTGITRLGQRAGWDIDGTTPAWSSGTFYNANIKLADNAGTSIDPKLVITYTLSTNGFFALL